VHLAKKGDAIHGRRTVTHRVFFDTAEGAHNFLREVQTFGSGTLPFHFLKPPALYGQRKHSKHCVVIPRESTDPTNRRLREQHAISHTHRTTSAFTVWPNARESEKSECRPPRF